jgi:hypothetical protein
VKCFGILQKASNGSRGMWGVRSFPRPLPPCGHEAGEGQGRGS